MVYSERKRRFFLGQRVVNSWPTSECFKFSQATKLKETSPQEVTLVILRDLYCIELYYCLQSTILCLKVNTRGIKGKNNIQFLRTTSSFIYHLYTFVRNAVHQSRMNPSDFPNTFAYFGGMKFPFRSHSHIHAVYIKHNKPQHGSKVVRVQWCRTCTVNGGHSIVSQ